jgi:tetratricopeptide (TPR) repeat protein
MKDVGLAFLIVLLAIAAYVPALSGGFIWDEMQGYDGELAFLPFFEREYHRPLDDSLSLLGGYIWGNGPAGHHFLSTVIHSVNSLLVFVVGMLLLEGTAVSLIAALLFALHPVHTEAVAWVSARAELIMTLFFLGAFALYLHYKKTGKMNSLIAGSLFLFLAALEGQGALTFPVLALLVWYAEDKETFSRRRASVSFGISASAVLVCLLFMRGTGEFFPEGGIAMERLTDMPGAIVYYFMKLILPVNLSMVPERPGSLLYPILAMVPFALLALLYYRGMMKESFLMAWILITLSPALLIAASGAEPSIGERFLYLPSVGFCLLAALAFLKIKGGRAMLAVCTVPVIALYALGTYDRAHVWKDDLSVWEDALSKNEKSSLVNINYGIALAREGYRDRAVEVISDAVVREDLNESGLIRIIELFSYLGADFNMAEERLVDRLRVIKGEKHGYSTLGLVYFDFALRSNGDERFFIKAILYLEKALELSPSIYELHYYLGESYLGVMNLDKAEEHLARALDLGIEGEMRRNTEESLGLIRMIKGGEGG